MAYPPPPKGAKPFDLLKALHGEPVVMRNGTPVVRVTATSHPVFSDKHLLAYTALSPVPDAVIAQLNGQHVSTWDPSEYDLFMAPKTKKVWANLYGDTGRVVAGAFVYGSKADAESARSDNLPHDGLTFRFLQTIEVEVPEE